MSFIASHAVDVVSLIVSHAPVQSHVKTWRKRVTAPTMREKVRSKIPFIISKAPLITETIFWKVVPKYCPIVSRKTVIKG